jgi:hypothetical protein
MSDEAAKELNVGDPVAYHLPGGSAICLAHVHKLWDGENVQIKIYETGRAINVAPSTLELAPPRSGPV